MKNRNSNILLSEEQVCNPLIENFEQFYVKINGLRYPRSLPLIKNKSLNFECLNKSANLKRILLWNTFLEILYINMVLEDKIFLLRKKCPVTNCELTTNKDLISISDYVVVHIPDNRSEIPLYRPKNQAWIFMLYESPLNFQVQSENNFVFNLTSTYHVDSNFASFYEGEFQYEWMLNKTFNEEHNFHADKTDLVAALISNCQDKSDRLNYIKQLAKYIQVDIFGNCGISCSSFTNSTTSREPCREYIANRYKFYLAFENSICKDYITEKFFQILNYNIVPVVMGGGDYEKFVIYFLNIFT